MSTATAALQLGTLGEPIVVVGSGPVGVRVVQELRRHRPDQYIILCGAEAVEPYNRVRLSSFLMGELGLSDLNVDLQLPDDHAFESRLGCSIARIDRGRRCVVDARGREQHYAQLVLATGSTPHIPAISGIGLNGVFTFRDFSDAQKLFARRMRSRRCVVLGGGLLGLEAARAMRRFNTEVVVVEHNARLMPRQLDAASASRALQHIVAMQIDVVLSDGVRAIAGDGRVSGVALHSGKYLECDTVIVATGIRPNIDVARQAGLHVNRGIRIDDAARTNDRRIFAVGECAEHRNIVYGLLAPGLEQASVAAANLCGQHASYSGSLAATKLKVAGLPLFSVGQIAEEDLPDTARLHRFSSSASGDHITLVTTRGRLTGIAAIGDNPEISRLQQAVTQQVRIWPWQHWRFRRTGRLWREADGDDVASWPAAATVCNCTGVTRGQLSSCISSTCNSVAALSACTGAGRVCGSCRPLLQQLLGTAQLPPARGARWLQASGWLAAALALLLVLPWNWREAGSVQIGNLSHWWRDAGLKQISGYTLLTLSALILLMSLRKRSKALQWGDFAVWRMAHAAVGAVTLMILLLHTGGRLGSNLNFTLSMSFAGVAIAGGISSIVVAGEHRLGAKAARLRRRWTWIHILLSWPLPALLGLHILKAYFF